MTGADTARTVIGIIGNAISLARYTSPTPTFWRIWKKKSVEEFKPEPYTAMVMSCMLWIWYGTPAVHPDSTLVVTISSIGLAVELLYLSIFFVFAPHKARLKVIYCLFVELAVMAVLIVVTLITFHSHDSRSKLVGIFLIVFGFVSYASPLTIMSKVIRTRSVEYMPFYLSLTSFLNGAIWLSYAAIKFDLYITIVSGLGTALGAVQLILYACYCGPNGIEKGSQSDC